MLFLLPEVFTSFSFMDQLLRSLEAKGISRGSSQPRDQTQVSLIAGTLCTIWSTRESLSLEVKK